MRRLAHSSARAAILVLLLAAIAAAMPLGKALLLAHTEAGGGWTPPEDCILWLPFVTADTLDYIGDNDASLSGDASVDSDGLNCGTTGYATVTTFAALNAIGTAPKAYTAVWWQRRVGTITAWSGWVGKRTSADSVAPFYQGLSSTAAYSYVRDGGLRTLTWPSTPHDGAWHFQAIRVADTAYKVWTDGSTDASSISTNASNNTRDLWIGLGVDGVDLFRGRIANVMIFDRALSDAEIADIYAQGRTLTP